MQGNELDVTPDVGIAGLPDGIGCVVAVVGFHAQGSDVLSIFIRSDVGGLRVILLDTDAQG